MPIVFRDVQIESDYRMDKSQYGACPSGFSIIEHPFRVLVHDDSARLLIVATTTFGPADDPGRPYQQLIEGITGWHSALVINRCDLSTHCILINQGAEHAS